MMWMLPQCNSYLFWDTLSFLLQDNGHEGMLLWTHLTAQVHAHPKLFKLLNGCLAQARDVRET